MVPYQYLKVYRENDNSCLLQTESRNSKHPFVCCKQKRKFVFLGRPSINSDRRWLFQQTCPSMLVPLSKILYQYKPSENTHYTQYNDGKAENGFSLEDNICLICWF